MEETYPPVLLRQKRARIQGRKPNPFVPESDIPIRTLFWVTISRPVKMLFLCLDVFSLSLYQTFVYGVYYIFVTTMVNTFGKTYGFGTGVVGLSYIGFGVGACAGSLICGYMSDVIMRRWSKDGERKPEYRLPPLIPSSLFTPIGLLWFGW
jgi:MFS family permease